MSDRREALPFRRAVRSQPAHLHTLQNGGIVSCRCEGRKTTSAHTPCCSALAEGDMACCGMWSCRKYTDVSSGTYREGSSHRQDDIDGRQEGGRSWFGVGTDLYKTVDEYHKVVVGEEPFCHNCS
ncbi:unnamed protein product [Fusarium graminearum]|nr:unnamed protein product [Fusarium graminearum]CAG1971927.1 unnamed protein product [Fusarium graminearum]VTO94237.1 unnamed protein product [Fusarium graminearum]